MASDPYVRVFRRIIDDPTFGAIYDDDRALAAWLRLRIEADASWPSSASLPLGVNRTVVKQLAESGQITLQAGSRFRMPDIDEDRASRSESGRKGADARWRNADASQPDMQQWCMRAERGSPRNRPATLAGRPALDRSAARRSMWMSPGR